jgi:hypothetical protein
VAFVSFLAVPTPAGLRLLTRPSKVEALGTVRDNHRMGPSADRRA